MQNTEVIDGILAMARQELLLIADMIAQKKMNLQDIVEQTQQCVNAIGCHFVEKMCAVVEEVYSRNRPSNVVIKSKQTRRMLTAMGNIELVRNQYYDKANDRYFIAVDEALNICRYSRIENSLQAKILSDSAASSFGVAAVRAGCSRQTAFNVVRRHKIEEDKYEVINSRPTSLYRTIYIEADEDHIHLNDGKNAEVKLVYVHEGRKSAGRNRTVLINAHYFSTLAAADEIWERVAKYVSQKYGNKVCVHLSGDGAAWIKAGTEWFDNVRYHLDKFHAYRSLTAASAGNKKKYLHLRNLLSDHSYSAENELESITKQAILSGADASIRNNLIYLLNNYSEIDFSEQVACSAEGHISHVLSKRMSSRPMGWSIAGAERIAQLRCFMYNGGNFLNLVIRTNRKAQEKVVPIRQKAVVGGIETYRIPILDDKLSPTQAIIKKILGKN